MNKHIPLLVCLVLCALTSLPLPQKKQAKDGPVHDILANATAAERRDLKLYYHDLGDATEQDGGKYINTLAQWRQGNKSALGVAFAGTPIVGKYKGLDAAVEEVLQGYVGRVDVPLTSTGKGGKTIAQLLVEACRDVEAQCE